MAVWCWACITLNGFIFQYLPAHCTLARLLPDYLLKKPVFWQKKYIEYIFCIVVILKMNLLLLLIKNGLLDFDRWQPPP